MRVRGWFAGKIVLVLAVIALLGEVVMLLWNNVATVALSGLHTIDYVHALGLLVLCRILFGGFRGRGGGFGRGRWEKWQSMTPEEREAFSKRWNGCGPSRQAQ